MHADSNNHAPALFQMNTGFLLPGRPSFGSWVTYGLGAETDRLPAFVVMWDHRGGPVGSARNWSSGFLPPAYQGTPFRASGDPIVDLKPPASVSPEREKARLELLAKLNEEHLRQHPGEEELAARIASYELAFRMQMRSPEVVDLAGESADTQKLYGLDNKQTEYFGRQCLLARRLIERGVRFVQLYSGGSTQQLCWMLHLGLKANHDEHCAETDRPDLWLALPTSSSAAARFDAGDLGREHLDACRQRKAHGATTARRIHHVVGRRRHEDAAQFTERPDEFGYATVESGVSISRSARSCLYIFWGQRQDSSHSSKAAARSPDRH